MDNTDLVFLDQQKNQTMRKIYLALAAFAVTGSMLSQVTLTKAFNGFVSGDNIVTTWYDSTSAVPKNTGTNQVWNFTSMSASSQTQVITYTTASAGQGSSNFPSATLAEIKGGTETGYYNTSGANLEFLGIYDSNGSVVISATNTAIMAAWPISYGSSNNDLFAGTVTSGTFQTALNGAVSYVANGTGTVILPNGTTYNNCLMVVRSLSVNLGFGVMLEKTFSFYTPAFKFPIVEYVYNNEQGTTYFEFKVLSSAITGMDKNTFSKNELVIYPNPSSTELNINNSELLISGEVIDMYGKNVLSFNGSKADISMLEKGVYSVVLNYKEGTATRKFVKN